jgi:hypothetical protein
MIASARLGIPCSVKKARRLRAPFAHGQVDGSRHAGGDAGRGEAGRGRRRPPVADPGGAGTFVAADPISNSMSGVLGL